MRSRERRRVRATRRRLAIVPLSGSRVMVHRAPNNPPRTANQLPERPNIGYDRQKTRQEHQATRQNRQRTRQWRQTTRQKRKPLGTMAGRPAVVPLSAARLRSQRSSQALGKAPIRSGARRHVGATAKAPIRCSAVWWQKGGS